MVVTVIDGKISVPFWVVDIDSFRRWTDCDDFPEKGQVWWLCGEVWADMSKEQIFTHNVVKNEITCGLHGIAKRQNLGLVLGSGLFYCNFDADIAGNPDATFVSFDTMRSERIRFIQAKSGGYDELQGSPDMTLEIVSDSSVEKDYVLLKQAYWEAGIREYWLVDVRGDKLQFDILYHTPKGYATRRKKGGWVKSDVFGKSFRLTFTVDSLDRPDYTLETR